MVTTEEVRADQGDVALAWDAFLDDRDRQHVETFQRVDWKNIVRDLKTMHDIELPEGLEPHWVESGRAKFWQEQIVTKGVDKKDAQGVPYRERETVTNGWTLTSNLPANNAGQIAHWLGKGLRFRPPLAGVPEEVLQEIAPLSDESQDEDEQVEYACGRHLDLGRMAFKTWRAYIQHCTRYVEVPEADAPDEVLEKMQRYEFYCPVHDGAWNNEKSVKLHLRFDHERKRQFPNMKIDELRRKNNG